MMNECEQERNEMTQHKKRCVFWFCAKTIFVPFLMCNTIVFLFSLDFIFTSLLADGHKTGKTVFVCAWKSAEADPASADIDDTERANLEASASADVMSKLMPGCHTFTYLGGTVGRIFYAQIIKTA